MYKLKHIIISLLLFLIIGAGCSGVSKQPEENQSDKNEIIRIGFIGHLSGAYAEYSIPMRNAAQLAIKNFAEKTGRAIDLVTEDDASDANKAATAINKLINIDNIEYIISAQASGITSIVDNIEQEDQKIIVISLASAPGLTDSGAYIFRGVPSDIHQASKMVSFIKNELKSSRVAGLYINNAYGTGIRDIVENNLDTYSGVSELFESEATDVRTQLLKIKESKADTLVLVA